MSVRASVTFPASPPAAAAPRVARARLPPRARPRAARTRPRRLRRAPRAALDLDALDLGQTLGAIKRKEALLNLPGKVGLFGARETFEYLADPNAFIKSAREVRTRVQDWVFLQARDRVRIARSGGGVPRVRGEPPRGRRAPGDVSRAAHRVRRAAAERRGARATRANFGRVLGRAARERYAPILARQTRDFVLGEVLEGKCGNSGGFLTEQQKRTLTREGRITTSEDGVVTRVASDETATPKLQPGYDLRQFCLRSLFELFLGVTPPEALMNEMYAYNEGLLALGKLSPEFEEGQKALKTLLEYVEKHYRTIRAQGKLESDERFFPATVLDRDG